MLTRDQITGNISAMEKQGASQQDVQGYLDSLKTSSGPVTSVPDTSPAPDGADHSWVTGDKHFVPQLGDAILGKADPNYQPQGAVDTVLHTAASGIRPVLNLPTSLLRGVEDLTKVVPNAVDLAKKQGVGGLGQGALDLAGNLASPFIWLGKNVTGAIASGIDKVTGKPFDPDAEAAFQKTVGQVSHPLDTATNIAKTIYSTSQDQPMAIPLALEGGGQTLSKLGVKNVGPIATEDVIGSTARPVIEGTKTAVDTALKPVVAPLQDVAFNKRVDEFSKVLNPSKGLAASEAKYEKNSPQFAAQLEQEGVKFPFGKDGRGRLDTTAAQDNVDTIAQRDNATMGRLLESSGITTNLDEIAANAKAEAMRTYKGTAQDAAIQHIDDEMSAYKRQYANQGTTNAQGQFIVPGKLGNEIKQDLWSKSKFPVLGSPLDQTKAGTSFLMGQSIKNAIQDAVGGDNIVGRLNQRLGDIASLQKMLQKAQGGAIHGGFASRMAGRIVGAIAGSAGGPVGSITGAITGDMISEALNNPMRPLSWAQAVLSRASTETPDLLKEVEARIGKNAQDMLNRKLLPAPAPVGSDSNPHIMGGPTPPPSGIITPKGPGGLYEYLQNQEAAQKAAGVGKFAKTLNGELPVAPTLNASTAVHDSTPMTNINMSKETPIQIKASNKPGTQINMNDNAPFNTRANAIASGQSQAEKNAVAAKAAVKQNIKYPAAGLSTRDITKLHPEDHDLLARGYEAYKTGDELSSSDELGLNRLLDHIGVNTNQSIGKVRAQMLAILNGERGFKGTDLRNLTGPKSNFGRAQTASAADALPAKKTNFGRSK